MGLLNGFLESKIKEKKHLIFMRTDTFMVITDQD